MDWQALTLSVKLSLVTLLFLLPIGILFGRWLAYRQFIGKSLLQTVLALPTRSCSQTRARATQSKEVLVIAVIPAQRGV